MAVGCWDGTLTFYNLNGSQAGETKRLGYDPCDVSFFGEGDCVVVAGAGPQRASPPSPASTSPSCA